MLPSFLCMLSIWGDILEMSPPWKCPSIWLTSQGGAFSKACMIACMFCRCLRERFLQKKRRTGVTVRTSEAARIYSSRFACSSYPGKAIQRHAYCSTVETCKSRVVLTKFWFKLHERRNSHFGHEMKYLGITPLAVIALSTAHEGGNLLSCSGIHAAVI